MPRDTSAGSMSALAEAGERRAAPAPFRSGVTLCIINTIIGAGQPVITRWGAVNLDPLLFCTGAVVFATLCTIPLLHYHRRVGIDFRPALPRAACLSSRWRER